VTAAGRKRLALAVALPLSLAALAAGGVAFRYNLSRLDAPARMSRILEWHRLPCAAVERVEPLTEGVSAVQCAGGKRYEVTAQAACSESLWCLAVGSSCYDVSASAAP
jgi:hypothetical protein